MFPPAESNFKFMARIARLVIPDYPQHIIQRGNRRQEVFFSDRDKEIYLELLRQYAKKAGLVFWAWCLMPNHVHFICVPSHEDSIRQAFSETHRRYSRMINFRYGWRGYLFQGRFLSYVLSEAHLYAAVRYVELNPVKACMVSKAEDYPWSSAQNHVFKMPDALCSQSFLDDEIQDWRSYLSSDANPEPSALFEKHAATGRPLGDQDFLRTLEQITGRILMKRKPGPRSHQEVIN